MFKDRFLAAPQSHYLQAFHLIVDAISIRIRMIIATASWSFAQWDEEEREKRFAQFENIH